MINLTKNNILLDLYTTYHALHLNEQWTLENMLYYQNKCKLCWNYVTCLVKNGTINFYPKNIADRNLYI